MMQMTDRFDSGALGNKPFCRLALLPGSFEATLRQCSYAAEIVARVPGGCLPFKSKAEVLNASTAITAQPHWKMEILMVVWVNFEHIVAHPPPLDIESAYLTWASLCMKNEDRFDIYPDAMLRAFPADLRGDHEVAHLFSTSRPADRSRCSPT